MTTSNGEPNAYGLTTPDSWWNTTLEEVCSGDGGRIQTGPFGSQLHAHDYRDEGTPVVMPKQLGDNMISTDGIARISDEDIERLSRHKLHEGDIVFSRRGDVTRRSYITKHEEGWLCGTGCMLIRPSHENLLNEFLAFFFSLPQFKDYITLNAVGATMPNLNTKILQNIPLFLPSRDTQRKIVAVISAYDDLIENNTRRIAIAEEMARAIYREWFVNFRFPGHENVKLVDSPLGMIPEGWEAGTIADYVADGELELQTGPFGTQLKASDYTESGTPVINVRNIGYGFIRPDKLEHLPIEICERLSQHLLRTGDIVFGRKGAVDRHVLVTSEEEGWMQGSDCIRMRSKSGKALPQLLTFAFRDRSHHDWMLSQCSHGATMASLNQDIIKRIPVLLPSSHILHRFAEISSDVLRVISLFMRRSENLRTTRDLLLPKLISGKLDVEDLDINIAALAAEGDEDG